MTAVRRLPGDEGIWFFIAADMVLFAMFFGSFAYQRSLAPLAYNTAQTMLESSIAGINTALLLTSSWLVARAVVLNDTGQTNLAQRMISSAIVLGAMFVTVKVMEYRHELAIGANPASEFFMFYFVVTGIHLLHVIGGIGILLVMRARLRIGNRSHETQHILESSASFWHMVDLLWLVIFPLFYLLR